MQSLDRTTLQEIVKLLAPYMTREDERRALLTLALGQAAPVLNRLDYQGGVEPFVVGMVNALTTFGEIEPGKPALWALLEVVRDRVGVDHQARIDNLRPLLNLAVTDPEPLPQATDSARLDFRHGGSARVMRLFANNQITLGRPRRGADLWLILRGADKDAMKAAMNRLSRHHASLFLDPEPAIRDNHSRNGSELNGDPLDDTPRALHDGDVIGFNNGVLQLRVRLGAEKWLRLERLNNAPSLESYLLLPERAPIGGVDAAIPTTEDAAASPAELQRLGGGFCIVSRTDSMQINGRLEPAHKTIGLRDGDQIELDGIVFRFLCRAYPG